MRPLSPKNRPSTPCLAVMNRLGGVRGLGGALQELQRGSDPCGTTQIRR